MVSFGITSLYTNIPIIDTPNIIKDYVHSDDQFTRKTAMPQDKFLDQSGFKSSIVIGGARTLSFLKQNMDN